MNIQLKAFEILDYSPNTIREHKSEHKNYGFPLKGEYYYIYGEAKSLLGAVCKGL